MSSRLTTAPTLTSVPAIAMPVTAGLPRRYWTNGIAKPRNRQLTATQNEAERRVRDDEQRQDRDREPERGAAVARVLGAGEPVAGRPQPVEPAQRRRPDARHRRGVATAGQEERDDAREQVPGDDERERAEERRRRPRQRGQLEQAVPRPAEIGDHDA